MIIRAEYPPSKRENQTISLKNWGAVWYQNGGESMQSGTEVHWSIFLG